MPSSNRADSASWVLLKLMDRTPYVSDQTVGSNGPPLKTYGNRGQIPIITIRDSQASKINRQAKFQIPWPPKPLHF